MTLILIATILGLFGIAAFVDHVATSGQPSTPRTSRDALRRKQVHDAVNALTGREVN